MATRKSTQAASAALVNESSAAVLSPAASTRAAAPAPRSKEHSSDSPLTIEMGMVTEGGGIDWSCYRGTKAQLEAEGVIPADLKWPVGDTWALWTSGDMKFRLHRVRPDSMKGPKSLWIHGDWWRLMWEPIDAPSIDGQRLRRTLERAAELAHRCTAAGEAERRAAYSKYCIAERDRAFQAFKETLLPSHKKPGRPARRSL